MDGDPGTRPSWQHEPCPPWCVTDHREDDAPEDRHHDSAADYVPVLLGVRGAGGGSPDAVTTDLLVVRTRRCGEADEWLFVGEPDVPRQHLLLSPESARRVATAISEQVTP